MKCAGPTQCSGVRYKVYCPVRVYLYRTHLAIDSSLTSTRYVGVLWILDWVVVPHDLSRRGNE